MRYILPSGTFAGPEYLSIPTTVSLSPNAYAVISDSIGRTVASHIHVKTYDDYFYVPWVTPEKSGAFYLSLIDSTMEVYKTGIYVLNDDEARHPSGIYTIPKPLPPVFFAGDLLLADSLYIKFQSSFGLPLDPDTVNYQFLASDGRTLSPVKTPALYSIGYYYVPGNLNLPGGEHIIRWTWKYESDSPLRSIDKPVSVINYNTYSSSSGVCAGNVGYVCCSCSPCQCMSDC